MNYTVCIVREYGMIDIVAGALYTNFNNSEHYDAIIYVAM